MAYLSFGEQPDGAVLPDRAPATMMGRPQAASRNMEGFSALEWSVVAIAEADKLSSLRQPGGWR